MTHHYRTLSNWALITSRVPQGSILGPLLLLLYMTDLPQIINNISTPILFADGTSVLFTHSNTTEFNANTYKHLV